MVFDEAITTCICSSMHEYGQLCHNTHAALIVVELTCSHYSNFPRGSSNSFLDNGLDWRAPRKHDKVLSSFRNPNSASTLQLFIIAGQLSGNSYGLWSDGRPAFLEEASRQESFQQYNSGASKCIKNPKLLLLLARRAQEQDAIVCDHDDAVI